MRSLVPLLLGLSLAACSNSDPKTLTADGTRQLGTGDAKGALASFDEALARMNTENPDFLRASMGRFQALARLEPTRTKNEFLAFHAAHPDRVQETDFKLVVDELLKRGSIGPATDIVEAGRRAFPESQVMAQLVKAIGDAAKSSKDPEAMSRLKGMGYVGDG